MGLSLLQIIGRLAMAALAAGLIGLERETAQKSAGLRTHVLVGVGAAIFTIVSIIGFEGGDDARVAAQVVTGIGFLGAGAIFREGATVKGLTTAAGLWAVAALGVAAGTGRFALALIGSILILAVLFALRGADEAVGRRTRKARDQVEVRLTDTGKLEALLKYVRRIDPDASQLSFKRTADRHGTLTLSCDPDRVEMVTEMLAAHKVVEQVEVLSPLYWTRKRNT